MVVLVQPRLSIIFISSKEGWCTRACQIDEEEIAYYSTHRDFFVDVVPLLVDYRGSPRGSPVAGRVERSLVLRQAPITTHN